VNPGSVFFDTEFVFHDGEQGEKLFIVLGCLNGIHVIAKTTSRGARYGTEPGCQPDDRFHNFYLPHGSCDLDRATWVCLDELYEVSQGAALQKRFGGAIEHVCDLPAALTREIQDCALFSDDTTAFQQSAIEVSLAD
jgi:hypothetical protein